MCAAESLIEKTPSHIYTSTPSSKDSPLLRLTRYKAAESLEFLVGKHPDISATLERHSVLGKFSPAKWGTALAMEQTPGQLHNHSRL